MRRMPLAIAAALSLLAPGLSAASDPLYCYFTVHVDPGPFDTPSGWQKCNFIMDEMARVFESHGLPLYVAVSWNWSVGCATFGNTEPGTIGDLAARGHEIGLHEHGGAPIQVQFAQLSALAGSPPIKLDGWADPAVIVPLGIEMGGNGPNKDVPTQLYPNGIRPYRPDASNPYEEDPSGPLLAMPTGPFTASGYEPDSTPQMTQALLYDLSRVVPGKLHTHATAVTHPDEFLGKTNPQIVADLAKFDAWLSAEIDPRIASGEIVWVTPSSFLSIYKAWEAGGGTNDDIFPPLPGVIMPDWSAIDPTGSGLTTDWIAAVEPDGAGGMWFGAGQVPGGGLFHLDASGTWTAYTSGGPGTPLSDLHLFLFVDSSGRLWSTNSLRPDDPGTKGLSVFDGASFATWPAGALGFTGLGPGFVWEAAEDPYGAVWVGTGSGAARFDGSSWTAFTPTSSPLSDDRVFNVSVDPAGRKWFGTHAGGIDILDDKGTPATADDVWTHLDEADGLPSRTILDVTFDPEGAAWIATSYGAVLWNGAVAAVYDIANSGLPNDLVTRIFVDSRGDVWFGTYGGGAARLDPETGIWDTFRRVSGELAGDFVLDIAEDDAGRILLAHYHGGGVSVYDPHLVIDGAPRLGQPFTFHLLGDPWQPAWLLVSAGTGEAAVAGIGTLLLDPAAFFALPLAPIPPSGSLDVTVNIPNDPALVTGLPIHLQGLRLSSVAPPSGSFTYRESTMVLP